MERNAIRITCLALMAMAGVCFADIVYVTTNGVGGGATWGAAASLTNALTVCQEGDQLWIEGGTYDGTTFTVATNNIMLYGGFTNGMSTLGERDWTNYPVILDGENTRRVVAVTSTNATLDGLVVSNSGAISDNGGGINKTSTGLLVLRNCIICENAVDDGSGRKGCGAYVENGSLIISNCTFRANSTYISTKGQGLYLLNVNTVIDCSQFVSNGVGGWAGRGCWGGGICCDGGTLAARACSFIGNAIGPIQQAVAKTVYDYGGAGVCVDNSAVAGFTNCVFLGNHGDYSASYPDRWSPGSGICIKSGTVTADNCTFRGNVSSYGKGGAIYLAAGALTVRNCILWTNTAPNGTADEIYVKAGTATVDYNCLTGPGAGHVIGVTPTHTMTNDPLFASATDCHLSSHVGRYNPVTDSWPTDAGMMSPCIDAGDPSSSYANETNIPAGANGGRVNLGAYGNMWQASKSPAAVAPQVTNSAPSIDHTSATLRGELTAGSLSVITFNYGTNPAVLDASIELYPAQTTGSVFGLVVADLLTNQIYYYTCFASNSLGTNTAAPVTNFTTGTAFAGGGSTVIHVDADAAGEDNGHDWANAFKSVVDAVGAVDNPGTNEIWIAEGAYDEGRTLTIAEDVSIYGGFTGTETARSQRSVTNVVTLGAGKVVRVISITSGNIVLDGMTIRDGRTETGGYGGGINKTSAGTLTLANCTIRDNDAYRGLGCSFAAGSVTMTNCIFANYVNDLSRAGCGFYASGADVVILACAFTNNGTPIGWSGRGTKGAAVYFENGALTVSNSLFAGNTGGVLYGGGAAYIINAAPVKFINCAFHNNHVGGYHASYPDRHSHGGALYIDISSSQTATVENCSFSRNTGNHGDGGAICLLSGKLIVKNSILWTNRSIYWDGAYPVAGNEIFADGADCTVTISYTDLTSTNAPWFVATNSAGLTWLDGILELDPSFVSTNDLHLKSEFGRWIGPAQAGWTNDDVTSLCIDAGDPTSQYSLEPFENGGVINLGAYGNTVQASKAPGGGGTVFMVR